MDGVPNRGTEMCAHQSQAVWEYTISYGLSCAQVFADIVGAFDAALRHVIFDQACFPHDDAAIAAVVRGLGFGPEAMHDIVLLRLQTEHSERIWGYPCLWRGLWERLIALLGSRCKGWIQRWKPGRAVAQATL